MKYFRFRLRLYIQWFAAWTPIGFVSGLLQISRGRISTTVIENVVSVESSSLILHGTFSLFICFTVMIH